MLRAVVWLCFPIVVLLQLAFPLMCMIAMRIGKDGAKGAKAVTVTAIVSMAATIAEAIIIVQMLMFGQVM